MIGRLISARRNKLRTQDAEESAALLGEDVHEMVNRTRNNHTRHGPEQMEADTTNFNELLEGLNDFERDQGDRLRRHLQFFFMNPLEKWRVRHQFPWKLALQVFKIIIVTAQLILFAEMRMSHVDFMEDTNTVMRHKFMKDWDSNRDALTYPPNEGRYSVYDGKGIFEHLAYIVTAYYSIQTESFASFSYDLSRVVHHRGHPSDSHLTAELTSFNQIPYLEACMDRIANVTVMNNTYEFDIRDVNECIKLNFTKEEVISITEDPASIVKALESRNITFHPEDALRISKATINFRLRTIHFSSVSSDQSPECYLIKASIIFDNSRHTGQVHILLSTLISYVNECNGRVIKGNYVAYDTIVMGVLDVLVLLMSTASLALCLRALIKAHLLKNRTVEFFEQTFRIAISLSDKLDFLNLWYVMIVVNDICLMIGTISKISIEFRDFDSDLFTLTGILLGMGALMVYVGVLRYFGFFSQYNILILTMKKAIPNILRFMSCAAVLYAGFLIAGWVIIGPYSMKFRTLAASSEALFSLLNGDDMFATFFTINDSNTTIKIFGTIYIYLFVSLFIYVVLSLFIAIIMDAYEIVKDRYEEGLSVERSPLKDFLSSSMPPDRLSSPSAQERFAPSSLLNLGRFSSFSNPLNDTHEAPTPSPYAPPTFPPSSLPIPMNSSVNG